MTKTKLEFKNKCSCETVTFKTIAPASGAFLMDTEMFSWNRTRKRSHYKNQKKTRNKKRERNKTTAFYNIESLFPFLPRSKITEN